MLPCLPAGLGCPGTTPAYTHILILQPKTIKNNDKPKTIASADVDPEQAVAVGAALHAGLLTGAAAGGLELMDGSYVEELQGRASGFQV